MRWRGRRQSSNIEDRRGMGGRRGIPFPMRGGRRVRMGRGGGLGLWGIVIIVVISLLLGKNPLELLGMMGGGMSSTPQMSQQAPTSAQDQQAKQFVSVVLADTEDTWQQIFQQEGSSYQPPKLVLYTDYTQTACGMGQSASGPFYCPADDKVYLDLGFMGELQRLGAPGDFAMAYVIAHEIGHHIQNLVGTSSQVQSMRQRLSKAESNALSVKLELQADCYAGVWAHYAQRQAGFLEEGDIQEGLEAASAVGDDRLQRRAGRSVQPESFTHGSSQQRMQWFKVGYSSGDADQCNTFGS